RYLAERRRDAYPRAALGYLPRHQGPATRGGPGVGRGTHRRRRGVAPPGRLTSRHQKGAQKTLRRGERGARRGGRRDGGNGGCWATELFGYVRRCGKRPSACLNPILSVTRTTAHPTSPPREPPSPPP